MNTRTLPSTSTRSITPLKGGRVKVVDGDTTEIIRLPQGSVRLVRGPKFSTLACGSPHKATVILNGTYAELHQVFEVITGERA